MASTAHYSKKQLKEAMGKFLKHYAKYNNFTKACDYAVVGRKTVLLWMDKYPKFQDKFDDLHERFMDNLESVAIERAIEKSDALMTVMLKAGRPKKYREQHQVDTNAPSPSVNIVFSKEEWGDMPNYVNGDPQEREKPSDG